MAKHNRNITRKMMSREMSHAIKDLRKSHKRAVTPEVLQSRFEHIMHNQSDAGAILSYGEAFEKSFFKANSNVKAQLKQMLKKQFYQVRELVNATHKTEMTPYFKKLFDKLRKIK